jgi:hypothetical protein
VVDQNGHWIGPDHWFEDDETRKVEALRALRAGQSGAQDNGARSQTAENGRAVG